MKHNTLGRGLLLAAGIILLAMGLFTTGDAAATTTPPVLWSAGGLSAGNDSAGQAARVAVDAAGNVAIVSGPAYARSLAVTSYTAAGALRGQGTVSANSPTCPRGNGLPLSSTTAAPMPGIGPAKAPAGSFWCSIVPEMMPPPISVPPE